MVVLTENLVLSKARTDSLLHVKNLNLWGNDLTDVSILQRLPNVEVLSLSVNRISSLHDFQYCSKLTELYLRKNEISNLEEVQFISSLKYLKVLWLSDNPCADKKDYRLYVIKVVPGLTKLDNAEITDEERLQASKAVITTATPRPASASAASRPPEQYQQQHHRPPSSPQRNTIDEFIVHHKERTSPKSIQSSSTPASKIAPPSTAKQGITERRNWNQGATAVNKNSEMRPRLEDPDYKSLLEASPPKPFNKKKMPTPKNSNVLTAVMSLLQELDKEGLTTVKLEAEQLMKNKS